MTVEDLAELARSCPPGTLIPASTVVEALADRCQVRPKVVAESAEAVTWQERLWTAPAETRLGVNQLSEALDRPRSWVYRRTGSGTDLPRLPHRKLDGQLSFLVGEIREWIKRTEITVERGSKLQLLDHLRGA